MHEIRINYRNYAINSLTIKNQNGRHHLLPMREYLAVLCTYKLLKQLHICRAFNKNYRPRKCSARHYYFCNNVMSGDNV